MPTKVGTPSAPFPMPVPGSTIHAVGFSRWKRPQVRAFFQDSKVIFVSKPSQLPKAKSICVVTWSVRIPNEQFPADAEIIRLEDGFLRSVGLGADLTYQGELGDFWQQPRKPLGKLYESFYNHVVLAFATLPVWFPLLAAWVIIDPFYRVSVWKSQRLEASLKPSSPQKPQALEEHLAMPAE